MNQSEFLSNADTQYDSALAAIPELRWMPWIGENYNQHRILIMAESCYDDSGFDKTKQWMEGNPNVLRHLVNKCGLNSNEPGNEKRPFHAAIEKTLLNQPTSSFRQRETLWKNVAFTELVQRLLPSVKDRPNSADYDKGWISFLKVADIIKPRTCIKSGVLATGGLCHMLQIGNTGWIMDNESEFRKELFAINLRKGEHKMRVIVCKHPSARSFRYQDWAVHIRQNLPDVDMLFQQ